MFDWWQSHVKYRGNRKKGLRQRLGRLVRPIYQPLVPLFARLLYFVLRNLPMPCVKPTAWVLGNVGYGCARFVIGRRVLANLRYAYGSELSPRERRRLFRRAYMTQALCLFEAIALSRNADLVTQHLVNWEETQAKVEAALAGGRGLIVLSAHVGSWEFVGLVIAAHFPMVSVARRLRHEAVNRLLRRIRGNLGQGIHLHDESPRKLLRALADGNIVGIVGDRAFRGVTSMTVPYFGHPTEFPTIPFTLSRKTGAPLMLSLVIRGEGDRYRMIQSDPIYVPVTDHRDDDIRSTLEQWVAFLEQVIRAHPSHWLPLSGYWKKFQSEERSSESPPADRM